MPSLATVMIMSVGPQQVILLILGCALAKLHESFYDKEEKVRLEVVTSVCEAAAEKYEVISQVVCYLVPFFFLSLSFFLSVCFSVCLSFFLSFFLTFFLSFCSFIHSFSFEMI